MQIGPWPGGVDLDEKAGEIPPESLAVCTNCRLDPAGYPLKRPGHKSFGTTPTKVNGDNLVNFVARYYKAGGTKILLAAAGGKLKKIDDTTGVPTAIDIDGSAGNSMSSTNLCDWFVYKDRIYILDGVRPQRYNGTDNVYAGHFTHVSAGWTLTPGAGGALTPSSTYKYKMTNVAGDMGEGAPSAERSVALSGAQNRVTLSTLDSAAAKYESTAKRLYRTKANGSVFYFLAELAAGATSYVDDIADINIFTEFIPASDPPASARFAVLGPDERAYYFGMSGADASLVKVSDVGFPDKVIDTDFFAVANNDGDTLQAGARTPGGTVFFKRNSCWLLRAFGFGLINMSNRIGSLSPFSVVEVPGGIIFLSQEGRVYFIIGTSEPREISYSRVRSEFMGMTEAAFGRVAATYHQGMYQISYDRRGQAGYNHVTMEYDLKNDRWYGPHENANLYTPSYYSVWDTARDRYELVWGEARAAAGSYLYVRDEFTLTDRGTKFLSTVRGSQRALPSSARKIAYKAFMKGRFSADALMQVSMVFPNESKITAQMLAPSIAGTDEMAWDESDWDADDWVGEVIGEASGSFVPKAAGAIMSIEISDGATATEMKVEEVELLLDVLPLK